MKLAPKYRRWIVGLLLFYIAGAAALSLFQEKLLFHPKPVAADYSYPFQAPFHEINIVFNKEATINIGCFTVPDSLRKGRVVFFHGNRDNYERYADYAPLFTKYGYEVWMIDYPGFGKSTGKMSQEILYRDALLTYDRAAADMGADSIILYGKSIGTAMASYVASKRNCRNLILETPYYSITRVGRHFFPIYPIGMLLDYQLSNADNLKTVVAPVTLIHGTSDGIVPYDQSLALEQDGALEAKRISLVSIEGGSHNDLRKFDRYKEALDSLLTN